MHYSMFRKRPFDFKFLIGMGGGFPLVVSQFCFECGTVVLIAPGPGHCLPFR